MTGQASHTNIRASTVQPGWTVHIGPHDVYRHTRDTWHVERPWVDVHVTDVLYAGTVIVIYWDAIRSGVCGVVVYDRDDTLERVA